MIANCWESNIDVFFDTFIRKDSGETWSSPSAMKLKQILNLYKMFADLARYVYLSKENMLYLKGINFCEH